jgi:plasmid replication initiation protein
VKWKTTINKKQSKENEQYEQYKAAGKARAHARSEIAPHWKEGQNTVVTQARHEAFQVLTTPSEFQRLCCEGWHEDCLYVRRTRMKRPMGRKRLDYLLRNNKM